MSFGEGASRFLRREHMLVHCWKAFSQAIAPFSPVNEEPELEPEAVILNIDLRPVDTRHAISALRHYLELMEQQMPIVQACEFASLAAERPQGNDEEEQSLYFNEVSYLEQLFEDDLVPTMRYSFIVFLHTVLETRLFAFCAAMQRERRLPIDISMIRGQGIEQAQCYLTKLVGISVGDFTEWPELRTFQTVRNCIVHSYGYLDPRDDRHKKLRVIAKQQLGLSITHNDRISIDASFCQRHLAHISTFFRRLFEAAGWQ